MKTHRRVPPPSLLGPADEPIPVREPGVLAKGVDEGGCHPVSRTGVVQSVPSLCILAIGTVQELHRNSRKSLFAEASSSPGRRYASLCESRTWLRCCRLSTSAGTPGSGPPEIH